MIDPVRVNLMIEAAAWDRITSMATAAGTSRSGIIQWLVDNAQTDAQGRIVGWPDEELPMTG